MTAVPPPVPPEIVEKAAKAVHDAAYDADEQSSYTEAMTNALAATALAAVYGDIVGPLTAEIERLRAENAELRILRDRANAPRDALSATESVQGAVPRIPGTAGAQIASETHGAPDAVRQALAAEGRDGGAAS